MATYIDFSPEEEQALSLSQFLNQAKTKGKEVDNSFFEACAKLVAENHYIELWNNLLAESSVLFSETPEKDVEGFFAAVVSLLKRQGISAVHQTLPTLLSTLTSSTEDKSHLRLKILGNTYNILDGSPTDRYTIFAAILRYASASKHPEITIAHFKDIDKKVTEWGIDSKQTRELYKIIRDLFKQVHHRSNDVHKWTVKYLNTFESNSEELTNEAVAAALDAIRLPDLYQFDTLLDVAAIKQLEKDPKHTKLYQLLTIFVGESLDAFKSFTGANPGYVKQLGLDEEELTKKIKYLSLVSLASLNHEITYATVAKTLQINESEVELWVISAIGEGLLEAKMDQLKGIIRVTRSIQRIFTRVQWKYLSDNLSTWKKNVQILLNTLQECKHQTQQQALELARGAGGDVTQI